MIKKIFRLNERQVKKVLKSKKPFFAYWVVSNTIPNTFWYNRFAIILWWKSVKNSVERNYFRRFFFDLLKNYIFKIPNNWLDIVFVVKKQNKLDKKNSQGIKDFEKDILFLLKNILWKIN